MKCLNTPTCWRVDGPYTIIFKSKKQKIIGHGSVIQTPSLHDQGVVRCTISLNGPSKDPQTTFLLETHHVSEILDGNGYPFWKSGEE